MQMLPALAQLGLLLVSRTFAQDTTCKSTTQHLSDPPYENYFYSDCHAATQAVVTSPLPDSNLSIIGPRLIVAWPAGNSGICTFFEPQDGQNGSLSIKLEDSTLEGHLAPIYRPARPNAVNRIPIVGVTGVLTFNDSAVLTIPILGSIRTIRDFTEGPSLLYPEIQNAVKASPYKKTGALLSRLWLDNETMTTFSMTPYGNTQHKVVVGDNATISFGAGTYTFEASFNYPQLEQLSAGEVLSRGSQDLIEQSPDQTTSLSFLSYTDKLLAGAWRFLTYFGRDSMIAALLLQPVLSRGDGSAMEAVLAAVLERINRKDGSACHEETIGDYATWLNLQENVTSTAPSCSYIMIDTDYYLPVLMEEYFTRTAIGRRRLPAFLSQQAGAFSAENKNLTYGELAAINANRIMRLAAPFAGPNNQTRENLIHLKDGEIVGQWRDSEFGLGGGRIPFDVNTALVPAALRSIASLARHNASLFPDYPEWRTKADRFAQVWEDRTLDFFAVNVPHDTAAARLQNFTETSTFYDGPSHVASLDDSDGEVSFHALALNGYNDLRTIDVIHTDTCFRHFLLNTTNEAQLSALMNETAQSILRPFPAGLRTPVGLVVANPALASEPVLPRNFTNSAYHGTVVWSWQLAMMAKGLEHQLGRCECDTSADSYDTAIPDFCSDMTVYPNVRKAYNVLWVNIEANEAQLASEVWSWTFNAETGDYKTTPLGALPPPPGVSAGTESDIRQLWSLTFLAVKRNEDLK